MTRPPIAPVRWQPPTAPARSRQSHSAHPLPPLRLLDILGQGPEDVLVDDAGRVLTGVADGRILRLAPDNRLLEVLADTGGRPLGLEWLPDGGLLVCDARRGLLRVDLATGVVTTLVSEVDGRPIGFCNNAAVAGDGTIYFSDSSRRFGVDAWKADLLEHSGTGRLLRRGLAAEVTVLADGLQFANGVALAPDGSFVVVAETAAYRLSKVWITGPRAGEVEVFVDNSARLSRQRVHRHRRAVLGGHGQPPGPDAGPAAAAAPAAAPGGVDAAGPAPAAPAELRVGLRTVPGR